MRIITTILRLAISLVVGIIIVMVRICLASGSGGGGGGECSGSSSTSSNSSTNSNHFPNEIRIDDVWYRNIRRVCTGDVEIRKGMGDSIEYVARNPHPILHPNLYHIYDTRGNKVGEFWNT